MKSLLWTLILLAILFYTHGTFEEIRGHKYLTPHTIDIAFLIMAFAACMGVGLL